MDLYEIYLLEQLSSIRNSQTISEAAEKLNLTQPTLSRSMKKLGDMLNVPLFIKEKNKLVLTEYGNIAADYADQILHLEKEMSDKIESMKREGHRINLVSGSGGPMYYFQSHCEAFSEYTVSKQYIPMREAICSLHEYTADFAITEKEYLEEGFFCTPLCTEKMYILVPADHPLAKENFFSIAPSFYELDQLQQHFYFSNTFYTWTSALQAMLPHSTFHILDSEDEYHFMILHTTLLGFISDLGIQFADAIQDQKELLINRTMIPIRDPEAAITFYLVCREDTRRKYASLINLIQKSGNYNRH